MPATPATDNNGNAATDSPLVSKTGCAAASPGAQSGAIVTDSRPAVAPTAASDDAASTSAAISSAVITQDAFAPTATADADESLMDALKQGEDAALAPLMQRWELPVKSFLLRLGLPSADVEDIAQEAFVRLYIKRAAYRNGSRFKPWLLTLAANLARNRMRWRLRRRESSIDAVFPLHGESEAGSATGTTPEDPSAQPAWQLAEQRQRREAVRAIVATLPGKLRETIICVDLESLSHAEAAQVLGCSPKAVENRLRRAREAVRIKVINWQTSGRIA